MIELATRILVSKTDKTHIQFFRYLFVGGFSAVVDIGSLFLMTDIFHINYLVSAAIAFTFGIISNYFVSTIWIFESKGNKRKEFLIFVLIGIVGLLWNELILWSLVSKIGLFYLTAKIISTGFVLFWNFGMRKKFVF